MSKRKCKACGDPAEVGRLCADCAESPLSGRGGIPTDDPLQDVFQPLVRKREQERKELRASARAILVNR